MSGISPEYESSRLLIFHQCHDAKLFILLPFFGVGGRSLQHFQEMGEVYISLDFQPLFEVNGGVGTS